MKIKKTILIMMIILALIALTACGGNTSNTDTNTNSNTDTSSNVDSDTSTNSNEDQSAVIITDAHMTTDVDSDGKPIDSVTSYLTSAEKLTVSAIIRNAPNNTKITFVWKLDGSEVARVDLDSGDIPDRYIYGYLTNTQAFPKGNYSVEIFVQDKAQPSSVVNFTVN